MSVFDKLWNLFKKDTANVRKPEQHSNIPVQKTAKKVSRSFQGFDDMILEQTGSRSTVGYDLGRYETVAVRWISRALDAEGKPLHVRVPSETTDIYKTGQPFTAAGKKYPNIQALRAQECEEPGWYKDIYGRDVLYLCERFPCFDSYDYMTENRYYRWMFLFEKEKLTRIYHSDQQEGIYVTEDVQNLETDWWDIIQKLNEI